jgi:hypothetical protein
MCELDADHVGLRGSHPDFATQRELNTCIGKLDPTRPSPLKRRSLRHNTGSNRGIHVAGSDCNGWQNSIALRLSPGWQHNVATSCSISLQPAGMPQTPAVKEESSGIPELSSIKRACTQPEEERGFRSIANTRVPACDLVWIPLTALRLVRKGMEEPWLGTLCFHRRGIVPLHYGICVVVERISRTYIPAPLQVDSCGETDIPHEPRRF